MVIITCPCCKNNHLIADNLGWFRDEGINVEGLAQENGQKVRRLTTIEDLDSLQDVEGLEQFKQKFTSLEQETKAKEAESTNTNTTEQPEIKITPSKE